MAREGPINVNQSRVVQRLAAVMILFFLSATLIACSGGGTSGGGTGPTQAATPVITVNTTANGVQNGASIVSINDSSNSSTIFYTVDGTTPTTSSQVYQAPFLVASNLTVKAIATSPNDTQSTVASQSITPNIASGTLVWSDEFNNSTGAIAEPNPAIWTYDTGNSGFGNHELENYCAWGSNTSPCSTANPNAFVDTNGYLNIVAEQPSAGVYTSARLKTEGLFSLQYGRVEVRAQVPEAQGFWPAFWLLGNNIATVNWPACGEQDVLERIDAAATPDWNAGSIHGTGFTGGNLGTTFYFPAGQSAAQWHTYGMIWSPGSVDYYIDDASSPYATYSTSSISGLPGAVWPFDAGQSNFIIINLAVGGDWPGSPNSSTPFPSTMLVDYVRVYTK